MADTDPTAALEEIRERYARTSPFGIGDPYHDVPRLLAAIEAVLKQADEWEADIAELAGDIARARKSHHASDHAQAQTDEALAAELRQCANGVREAITSALTLTSSPSEDGDSN